MGTTHSGPSVQHAQTADPAESQRNNWSFHAHEKHAKENNSPQAKHALKTEEDSGFMTVQKFNVDDDDDLDGPVQMFQRVGRPFNSDSEPKRQEGSPSIGSKEKKASRDNKMAKEESKPVISRKYFVFCCHNLIT